MDSAPHASLGRYTIVRTLGRGAMGVVYEARDPKLERPVAIKTILKSHLLDSTVADEYSARFVREAQAVARLAHPNIVTVFDFGEEGDAAYIVMEFIHGRELAAHFEAGEAFALPRVVQVMGELLAALGYAHERGIVHRDVKPQNVMLDAAGRVKLTDFGVARLADPGSERTTAGTMVGTPSYMAPEQVLGHAVGSRADLFAAGVVLYQFLTGKKPFGGGASSFSIQQAIVHEHPPAPSSVDAALPKAFDAIVARALAKDPAQRFASAAEFARALQAALADGSSSAHAAPPPDPDATVVRPSRGTPLAHAPASATPAPTMPLAPREASTQAAASAIAPPSAPTAIPASPAPTPAGAAAARSGSAQRVVWLAGLGVAAFAATGVFLWMQPAPKPPPAVDPAAAAPSPSSAPIVVSPPAAVAAPPPPAVFAAPAPTPTSTPTPAPPPAVPVAAPAPAPVVAAPPPAARPPARAPAVEPPGDGAGGRAAAIRESASRCATLLQRLQLGDTLSGREQETLRKECNR